LPQLHIKPSVQTLLNISLRTIVIINQSVLFAPLTSTFLSPLHQPLTSVLVLFVRPLLSFGTQYHSQSVHLPPSTPSNAAFTSASILPRSSSPRASDSFMTFCTLISIYVYIYIYRCRQPLSLPTVSILTRHIEVTADDQLFADSTIKVNLSANSSKNVTFELIDGWTDGIDVSNFDSDLGRVKCVRILK